MSVGVEVVDLVTPELARMAEKVKHPRLLMQACGRRVERDLRRFFGRKNAEPNKKGWWKSNWWNREVKRNTAFQSATDTEATVAIASVQFLHRLRGGIVSGNPMLAIPVTEAAKRKGSPGEWSHRGDGQLQFIVDKVNNRALLVPGKDQSHGAIYVLKRSVRHEADAQALPSAAELELGVLDEASRFVQREVNL